MYNAEWYEHTQDNVRFCFCQYFNVRILILHTLVCIMCGDEWAESHDLPS